jgi:hypothetical protein
MVSPRQPLEARSRTAQTSDRQLCSPGSRPITLTRRRVSPKVRSIRLAWRMRRWCSLGSGGGPRAGRGLRPRRRPRRGPAAPLGDEPLGAPAGLGDGGLAVLLDLVEDRPVVPLHLALGVGGDLGDAVPAAVDQTALVQAGRKRALDRRAPPLPPSAAISSGAPSPRLVRSASSARQASVDSAAPGARPTKQGCRRHRCPGHQHRFRLGLGCSLQHDPSRDRSSIRVLARSRRCQGSNSARRRWQIRLTVERLLPASWPKTSTSILHVAVRQARTQQEITRVSSALVQLMPAPNSCSHSAAWRGAAWALQLHRSQRGLQGAGLPASRCGSLRRVSGPALVAAAAELLTDDLFDDALEGQPHRPAGHLLDDAQQLPPPADSSGIWARIASVGDTRTATGVGPPS